MARDPKEMFKAAADPATATPPAEPTPPPPADNRPTFDRESYAWASDVFFVYDHLNATAKEAKSWKSPAREALLKHAKADMTNFMGQLIPKAMQLYEKAKDKNGDLDSVIAEEKKTIRDMKRLLAAAIEEAAQT